MNFLVASTDAASAGGGSLSFFLIYIVIIGFTLAFLVFSLLFGSFQILKSLLTL